MLHEHASRPNVQIRPQLLAHSLHRRLLGCKRHRLVELPLVLFSSQHDGLFDIHCNLLVGSKRFVPCVVDCALTASPSSRQRSPQCGGNWHIDDLFYDALRHALTWWTTLLASRTSFYTSHTQPTFIVGIGTHENALRCHVAQPGIQQNWKRRLAMSSNASTKARNLLSIVLVLTVHREEMESSVQDATRCSVQFVHNPSGNESRVLSPPRTCNAWISLPQALRLWREKKRY